MRALGLIQCQLNANANPPADACYAEMFYVEPSRVESSRPGQVDSLCVVECALRDFDTTMVAQTTKKMDGLGEFRIAGCGFNVYPGR